MEILLNISIIGITDELITFISKLLDQKVKYDQLHMVPFMTRTINIEDMLTNFRIIASLASNWRLIIPTVYDKNNIIEFLMDEGIKIYNGIIFIYDINNIQSFAILKNLFKNVINKDSNIPIILVGNLGNKTERFISEIEGKELAKEFNMGFLKHLLKQVKILMKY